jgi:hypothetical protein
MKYVIVDFRGLEVPILFPCFWNHDDIAAAIQFRGKPVSAGFVKRDDLGNLYVTGRSQSLNLASRPEDLDLIIKQLEFEM